MIGIAESVSVEWVNLNDKNEQSYNKSNSVIWNAESLPLERFNLSD